MMELIQLLASTAPSASLGVYTICVTLNLFMGFLIIRTDWRSATHRIFALLTLAISLWLFTFFFSLQPTSSSELSLILIRLSLAFAVPINTFFLFLAVTFPDRKFGFTRRTGFIVTLLMVAVMVLAISPYTFTTITLTGGIPNPTPGLGLLGFALFVLGTNVFTFYRMAGRFRSATGPLRLQLKFLLIGTVLFLFAMFATILMPTLVFSDFTNTPLAPLYALAFIVAATYASLRHGMFNMKVLATESFIGILAIVFFGKLFTSASLIERFIDLGIFTATVSFGILLINSVHVEIRARQQIQTLANTLSETNWELAKKNEQLRIIDQRKSEFVSIVSHQLRTPITAIKGYASMLLEGSYGDLSKEQKEPMEKVFISSGRLAAMVSDFLDISKIEQGTMVFNFAMVDFGAMVADVANDLRPKAEENGLVLNLIVPEGESFRIIADEGKIRQVLSNLIDNAIKYTPTGGITVTLMKDTSTGQIHCTLRDTGIGLSQDDLHHLFGKFARGEGGAKMRADGSGLGLYVAKRMIEAHRGTIWVDSEGVGRGSIFTVTFLTEENPESPRAGTWTAKQGEEEKTDPTRPVSQTSQMGL